MSSSTTNAVVYPASVPRLARCARWPSKASKPTGVVVTHSNTAARQPPLALRTPAACHRAGGVKPGAYGRILRIDLDNRHLFTPTPWGSPSWRRGYHRRRTAMERINSFNFETHYIRGRAKRKTRVGRAVMMALALARADALLGRCCAISRHRLTPCPSPDSAARYRRLPAEGQGRAYTQPCSYNVPK